MNYLLVGNGIQLALLAFVFWRYRTQKQRAEDYKQLTHDYRGQRDYAVIQKKQAEKALAEQIKITQKKLEVEREKIDFDISDDDLVDQLSNTSSD